MQVRQKTGGRAPRVMHLREAIGEILSSHRDSHDGEIEDLRHRCEALESFIEAMMNAISETNPPLALKILNLAGFSWEQVGGGPPQP